MLEQATVGAQVDAQQHDRMRVLVVGAGVAGLTLAQLLRREGLHPVLLERSASGTEAGYMLGLMPIVDPAIDALGVWDSYEEHSVAVTRYGLRNRLGRIMREYSFPDLFGDLGEVRGIERGALRDVLSADGAQISFDASVSDVREDADGVHATIEHAAGSTEAVFDLVVAADGLGSHTRSLVLEGDEVDRFVAGWGGWVAWDESDDLPTDRYDETWGAGFFVGTYPVRGRTGVFVGGFLDDTEVGSAAFVQRIRSLVPSPDLTMQRALRAVEESPDPYFWDLTDVRSRRWRAGRVQLLGDAAAGFLPTAGIGAAMAMESALGLADQLLSLTGDEPIERALDTFERIHRPRVEAAQQNSRQLARLIAWRSPVAAAIRDALTRFIPVSAALGPIRKLVRERPVRQSPGARSRP
jgi:2-polyprenyl-6-methoxyphenol hydroxylase-like FAD-dependent oxidoreductase